MKVWRNRGIRWRLASLYLGIFAVGLGVFCALLFQYFQRTQVQAFDTALYNFAVDINSNLEMDFVGRLFVVNSAMTEAGKLFPFHLGNSFFEFRDVSGRVLLHSKSLGERRLPLSPETLKRLPTEKAIFETIRPAVLGVPDSSPDFRLISYFATRSDWREPLLLQIAVPLDLPQHERRDLLLFFAIAIPTFLLIAGMAGFWMSRRALRPVHQMILKAASITGVEKLKERIPVPRPDDEIRELAVTFNQLLDRLEGAFASQDRFVSNASHQLKTPLTILKNELNLLQKAHGQGLDLSDGLRSVSDEIQRMILLVQDLLLLARLEAGHDTLDFSPVRLDEVMMKVVSRVQKISSAKSVRLRTQLLAENPGEELDVETPGDEELLDSMLENFVENAVKYAPENTNVEISLKGRERDIELTILDSGPGIPQELKGKMFERFSRGQPSHIVPGSGLGLAIAAEIAKIHGIQVAFSTPLRGSGTLVTLVFRRASLGPA
ncbi:MAG: sensor histidine kinase [Bdellovibrionales bacterium]